MYSSAAEIFAFDMLIQNSDRRPNNPNLQYKGEQFAIFDHDLALITEGVLFWKPPWEEGALDVAGGLGAHVLCAGLKGTTPNLDRLTGAWEAITDDRLEAYRMALPPEWDEAANVADTACLFLRQLRDNINPAIQEVLGVLL